MSNVAIVGGHGQIAQQLIPLLATAGHTPIALVRDSAQGPELEAQGAQVRILDLEKGQISDFVEAFESADTVVFAAGGGGDGNIERKRTVDLEGSLKSVEAATQLGISHFVQISAIGVDDDVPEDTDDVWRAYVEAKRDADHALRASSLHWSIVRPGRLTDDPGTGKVSIGVDVPRDEVPRADVAATIAALVDAPPSANVQFNLVTGATPISSAIPN